MKITTRLEKLKTAGLIGGVTELNSKPNDFVTKRIHANPLYVPGTNTFIQQEKNDDFKIDVYKAGKLDTPEDIEDEVRLKLSKLSVNTLFDLMEDTETPPQVRANVARYVLDRVLGTPMQRSEVQQTTTEQKILIKVDFGVTCKNDVLKNGVVFDETIDV